MTSRPSVFVLIFRYFVTVFLIVFMISLFWHPRLDADPAHRWLRSIIVDACRTDAA